MTPRGPDLSKNASGVSIPGMLTTARLPDRVVWPALLALFLPGIALAQSREFSELHTWTDLATIYDFSDRFRYDGDYGVRGLISDPEWTLIYVRPSVRYRPRAWVSLHGGAAVLWTFLDGDDLPELRPWLGVRFLGPSPGGFTFSNYLRLEMRAIYLKAEGEWDLGLRGRWQLQVTSPEFRIGSWTDFDALASIEPFFDFDATTVDVLGDRFRVSLGIRKWLTPALRLGLNYLFHNVRVADGESEFDFDDHVARVRFTYRLN